MKIIIFSLLFLFNVASAEITEADICTGCGSAVGSPVTEPIKKVTEKIKKNFDDITFLDPVTVEKADSRQLAEMLVSRLHNKCNGLKDPSKNWANEEDDDSDIMMLVPANVVSSIQEYGFKNQHQTSSTGGANSKSLRTTFETMHVEMGLGYSNKTRELLPKYSLQVFKGKMRPPHSLPYQYGNVIFKFKKNVKKRATWYQQDSLYVAGQLHTNRLKPQDNMSCLRYCEAQIWGDLDMSDVESVIVSGGEAADSIKALGLPVYSYMQETDGSAGLSLNVRLSETPIYTPQKLESKNQKITDKPVSELQNFLQSESSSPKKQILKSHILSKLSNDELIKAYKKSEKSLLADRVHFYYTWIKDEDFNDERVRTLAELAARGDDPKVRDFLHSEYKNAESNTIKNMALGGLTGLPDSELKPLLKQALLGEKDMLATTAFYMALKFKDDPKIQSLLQKHKMLYKNIVNKESCKMDIGTAPRE